MPAPVPKCSRRLRSAVGRVKNVRMPDRQPRPPPVGVDEPDGPAVRARAVPPPARRSLAERGSSGAPVTDPGGKVAARMSAQPWPGATSARTVDTRWASPGCCCRASSSVTRTDPGPRDPAEVVADQVGDHDVLREVLVREGVPDDSGALDRRRVQYVAVAGQEQFGRGGDDPLVAQIEHALRTAPGCRRPAARPARTGRRPAGRRRAQQPAEIHLVDVTGGDVRADCRHPGPVLRLAARTRPVRPLGVRATSPRRAGARARPGRIGSR